MKHEIIDAKDISLTGSEVTARFLTFSGEKDGKVVRGFVDLENPENSYTVSKTHEDIADWDAKQRASVQIGHWAAPCCCQDAREIKTQEDIDDILEDWELGWSIYSTKKAAQDALCDCSDKTSCPMNGL